MFRMRVTTNFKFRLFEKGKDYKKDLIPADVFERWLQRKLIKVIQQEETTKPKKGRSKKDDNSIVKSNVSDTSELSDNG